MLSGLLQTSRLMRPSRFTAAPGRTPIRCGRSVSLDLPLAYIATGTMTIVDDELPPHAF